MPLSNPFRRTADRPSLRERAAALRASFRPAASVKTTPPAPASAEARAAFHEACHQHGIRTAHLHDCPELMRGERDVWSTQSLMQALEAGEIEAAEYARLHPLASERELRFDAPDQTGVAGRGSAAGLIRGPAGVPRGRASGAVLEAPALVAGLDDLAMVGEAVEQRRGHLGVAGEHARPFPEGEVRGDHDRGRLVEPSLGAPEGHESQVIWLRGADDDRELA